MRLRLSAISLTTCRFYDICKEVLHYFPDLFYVVCTYSILKQERNILMTQPGSMMTYSRIHVLILQASVIAYFFCLGVLFLFRFLTARSVEDETRNAEFNGNRNPE